MRKLLAVALLVLSGCASKIPTSVVTPSGKAAYTADQILTRVDELQNTAIQAEASKAIRTPNARVIIQWCVDSAKVLKATPAGWQATVRASWEVAKRKLPDAVLSNPAWSAGISAVDVALATLGASIYPGGDCQRWTTDGRVDPVPVPCYDGGAL